MRKSHRRSCRRINQRFLSRMTELIQKNNPLFCFAIRFAPKNEKSVRIRHFKGYIIPNLQAKQTKTDKKVLQNRNSEGYVIEVTGFEPATFWSRTKRATKLRYTSITGADEGTRTLDLLITNRLLYQLSHIGILLSTTKNYSRSGVKCQVRKSVSGRQFT